MSIYKFIKIKGREGARTGYFVPNLYHLGWDRHVLKAFGFQYITDRLTGWTVWYVRNNKDYEQAIQTLNELKKTRVFDYKVST